MFGSAASWLDTILAISVYNCIFERKKLKSSVDFLSPEMTFGTYVTVTLIAHF